MKYGFNFVRCGSAARITTPPREWPMNEIRLGIISAHHSCIKHFISKASISPCFHISLSELSSLSMDEMKIVFGKLAAKLDLNDLISIELP